MAYEFVGWTIKCDNIDCDVKESVENDAEIPPYWLMVTMKDGTPQDFCSVKCLVDHYKYAHISMPEGIIRAGADEILTGSL